MVPIGTVAKDWWCPSNITLLELPPYSPELNPVERIWHYPLALRGRLSSGCARSTGGAGYQTVTRDGRHSRVQKFPEIRIIRYRHSAAIFTTSSRGLVASSD